MLKYIAILYHTYILLLGSEPYFLLGPFMVVDSSDGGLGYKSHLWFDVKTSKIAYYQFWFYTDGSSSNLYTTFDGSPKLTPLDTSYRSRWQKTDCFTLPVPFIGRIYIIAERGILSSERIAIDNVKVTENCYGMKIIGK